MTNRKKGYFGESLAAKYLKEKGYEILELNYYTPFGEIDLITKKENYIVFVEVKLRKDETFGNVLEQISKGKQKRIIQSAEYYLNDKELTMDCRFDYISLLYEKGTYRITHLEDAFDTNY